MDTGLVYTITAGYMEGDDVVYTLVDNDGNELELAIGHHRARPPVGARVRLVLEEVKPDDIGFYAPGTR